MNRVIGHIDLDYFYAQIEELEKPSLKGNPVLVCVYSGRTEDSGVVSTANYEARRFGIKSGMPIVAAKRKLEGKGAIFIPMDHEKYEGVSEMLMQLVRARVDILEQSGIDEAFFDVTAMSGGSYDAAELIALDIKGAILHLHGLTSSIGIGPNKILAKIASDYKKPDGLTMIRADGVKEFLSGLPVEKLYGVGSKTAKLLQEKGIGTVDGLAGAPIELLEGLFGRKTAVYLHNASNGLDDEPVVERGETTQVSRITTLKRDSRDAVEVYGQLAPSIESLWKRVVEKKLVFRSLSIIGIDTALSMKTKSKTLEMATSDLELLKRSARTLLEELLTSGAELRRVGVRVSDLIDMSKQSSLMEYLQPKGE